MRRYWRSQGLGVSRRLRELFGAARRLAFGFDEPPDDPPTRDRLVDEAIEQLYGARRRGEARRRTTHPIGPVGGGRIRIR
jgi:hypothetical protein